MSKHIQSITAKRIHGRYDIYQEFSHGINIIYGKNGAGKTTLLHILANVLNGDYERFAFLVFDEIEIKIYYDKEKKESSIKINRKKYENEFYIHVYLDGDEEHQISVSEIIASEREISRDSRQNQVDRMKNLTPIISTAYFPAFRTMIEAWSSFEDRGRRGGVYFESTSGVVRRFSSRSEYYSTTLFARDLFGDFVPRINYPSPSEIEIRMREEIRQARFQIGFTDRELLSQVFLDVFNAISQSEESLDEPPESIIDDISKLSDELSEYPSRGETERSVYPKLRDLLSKFQLSDRSENELVVRVLNIYKKSLVKRVEIQEESFETIDKYLHSVNKFLEEKQLGLFKTESKREDFTVQLSFSDGTRSRIRTLSSGERQIVTLIYAATHMNEQELVLIDEPEISLHIDWQRDLLASMHEQIGNIQIIACTHSPTIGADYSERMFELILKPTSDQIIDDETIELEQIEEEDF